MKHARLMVVAAAAALALAGCGSRLRGVYEGNGFFQKLEFTSSDKVEITFMGMTKEASYVVDGDKVKITNNGETEVLTIDDKGCLNGGGLIGTYCKGGESSAGGSSESSELGGTYRAQDADGGMTLQFTGGQKVRVTMSERGSPDETADGSYSTDGDRITVQLPGGMPLSLVRKGSALEGSFGGQTVQFHKQ